MNRSARLEKYNRVKALRHEGKTYEQISSQSGVSFKTVRRWLKQGGFPEYKTRRHVIEPFLPYLKTRLSQRPTTRRQLWIELQTQGFGGCLETVNSAIALIGHGLDEAAFDPSRVLPPAYRHFSVYDALKMFTCPLTKRSSEDQARFERLCQEVPLARRIHAWVEDMRHILCRHPLDRPVTQVLESLMQEAVDLKSPELNRFVCSIVQDRKAVEAALISPWSNGQTEGQVTKLKLIKRQRYGRSGFAHLRRCALLASAPHRLHAT